MVPYTISYHHRTLSVRACAQQAPPSHVCIQPCMPSMAKLPCCLQFHNTIQQRVALRVGHTIQCHSCPLTPEPFSRTCTTRTPKPGRRRATTKSPPRARAVLHAVCWKHAHAFVSYKFHTRVPLAVSRPPNTYIVHGIELTVAANRQSRLPPLAKRSRACSPRPKATQCGSSAPLALQTPTTKRHAVREACTLPTARMAHSACSCGRPWRCCSRASRASRAAAAATYSSSTAYMARLGNTSSGDTSWPVSGSLLRGRWREQVEG